MPRRLNVLMADVSAADAERVTEALRREGSEVGLERIQGASEMAAALDRRPWDLILARDGPPDFDALAALRMLRDRSQGRAIDPPLIIISDSPDALDMSRGRDAVREGARDYVPKGDLARLLIAIERELHDRANREDQRRAEANLRQTQKLDAVAQLAGGVAHDFNNLLTAIIAYSESMMYELPPDSPLRTEVAEIKKSGERACALTQRLLAFGRRRKLKPHVTNLNALIAGLEPGLRRLLGDHVDIILQGAADLGEVRVDVGQFEQAILDLASNARDAMPAGGTLTLRTENVDLREGAPRVGVPAHAQFDTVSLAPGWYVSLAVSDTGFGMDANTQAHAFEPFFTTREAGAGTGLGLATVYGTIRQSGGTITIESEVGRGTTMHLLLPRAQPEPETAGAVGSASAARATSTVSGHETILLVEDEELVRQMAVLTLERGGYRVLVARDGTEAIARAQAHAGEIHLLIADLVMPRIGGQELARVLRLTRPGLRVLHTIAYGDEAIATETALANSHATFLQKPFVATALADRVREVLAGERVGAGGRSPGQTRYSPKP